jgi:hypothetical protein
MTRSEGHGIRKSTTQLLQTIGVNRQDDAIKRDNTWRLSDRYRHVGDVY